MTLDDFKEMYPEASWLESKDKHERWSNELGEDTEHDSVWFNSDGEEGSPEI